MAFNLKTIVWLKDINSPYIPLLECVVNSLNSIQERWNADWKITIEILRPATWVQTSWTWWEDVEPPIIWFRIKDNWIWFTDSRTKAFDEPFTDCNEINWGKWYGRFTALNVFNELNVESIYQEWWHYYERVFSLKYNWEVVNGRNIICWESLKELDNDANNLTVIELKTVRDKYKDRMNSYSSTIAKRIFEHLLPFFLSPFDNFPNIFVVDWITESIRLNDYLDQEKTQAWNLWNNDFNIWDKQFHYDLVAIHWPETQNSSIILTAHNREVTSTNITKYVPEFHSTFSEIRNIGWKDKDYSFFIKAYISWDYLNENVDFQRESFNIPKNPQGNIFWYVSQEEIEKYIANIIKKNYMTLYEEKFEEKKSQIEAVIHEQMPYYSKLLKYVNIEDLPINASKWQIAKKMHEAKFNLEEALWKEAWEIFNPETITPETIKSEDFDNFVKKAWDLNWEALVHYMMLRKFIINLMRQYLKVDHTTDKHKKEVELHDIIFPTKTDSDETDYNQHNLWLLDENLVYSKYVVSDKSIFNNWKRIDLAVFWNETVYREDNNPSSPIFIYEFKRPWEDIEDKNVIEQITEYIWKIRSKEINKNFEDRPIRYNDNTPIYWYVVCDIENPKIQKRIDNAGYFDKMPDDLWYFWWHSKYKAYIQILSWDKVINDAERRHKAFFDKLGVDNSN